MATVKDVYNTYRHVRWAIDIFEVSGAKLQFRNRFRRVAEAICAQHGVEYGSAEALGIPYALELGEETRRQFRLLWEGLGYQSPHFQVESQKILAQLSEDHRQA